MVGGEALLVSLTTNILGYVLHNCLYFFRTIKESSEEILVCSFVGILNSTSIDYSPYKSPKCIDYFPFCAMLPS